MKICFIINPRSGTGEYKGIEKKIKENISTEFSTNILYTERPGHATELARETAKSNDVIVAVGGDGMMNETARGIMGNSASLGIIPTGSGNALARHLGIPMNIGEAISCLNRMHTEVIDSATINGSPFFAVAGTGFDAEVAAEFDKSKVRGFLTYMRISFFRFFSYKPAEYIITADAQSLTRTAFLISIANSSQYGNNAYIAPNASAKDGLLDICILKPFHWWTALALARRLFNRTIDQSRYMEAIRAKKIEIKRTDGELMCIHYDGETAAPIQAINISVTPNSLKVIVPDTATRL